MLRSANSSRSRVCPEPHADRASAFAVYTAIAKAFSSSLISFLEPCPLGAIAKTCCRTLACRSVTSMFRKDRSEKSCVRSLSWVHIFVGARFQPVGASFQPVGASFQLAHAFDTMPACRHKERWGGEFELWQQVFNLLIRQETRWNLVATKKSREGECELWVQVFNLHMPSTRWRSCRHKATPVSDPQLVPSRRQGSHRASSKNSTARRN